MALQPYFKWWKKFYYASAPRGEGTLYISVLFAPFRIVHYPQVSPQLQGKDPSSTCSLGEGCGTLVPLSIYFAPEETVVIGIRVQPTPVWYRSCRVQKFLHLPLDYRIRWDYISIRVGTESVWKFLGHRPTRGKVVSRISAPTFLFIRKEDYD